MICRRRPFLSLFKLPRSRIPFALLKDDDQQTGTTIAVVSSTKPWRSRHATRVALHSAFAQCCASASASATLRLSSVLKPRPTCHASADLVTVDAISRCDSTRWTPGPSARARGKKNQRDGRRGEGSAGGGGGGGGGRQRRGAGADDDGAPRAKHTRPAIPTHQSIAHPGPSTARRNIVSARGWWYRQRC